MNLFPFPDRVWAREELKRDVVYQKIPVEDRITICDRAWERGVKAAREIMERYPEESIRRILDREGLMLTVVPEDEVRGNRRTFGEYYLAKKEIILYSKSIEKWAEANLLKPDTAADFVLAHEFFHYLETTRLGDSSKLYQVPVLRIGKHVLLRSGVHALSEIAAHGFSRTYFETFDINVFPLPEKAEKVKEG